MKRVFTIALALLLASILFYTDTAKAQTTLPQNAETWSAQYWNNINLTGTPVYQITETGLTRQLGTASPYAGVVNADQWSARWTATVNFPATATYLFSTRNDDAMRVYVDGVLQIDDWNVQAEKTNHKAVALIAGMHTVTVEYFDSTGSATAALGWQNITNPTITNWKGEYFNNTQQSGTPIMVRDDANIDFNWGSGSPLTGVVNADQFSVRWTRSLTLDAGLYRFILKVDDGGRLKVGDQIIINRSTNPNSSATYYADYYHAGGLVNVQLDYSENAGNASANLTWQKVDTTASADDLTLSPSSGKPGTLVTARASSYTPNTVLYVWLGTSQTSYSSVGTVTTKPDGTVEVNVTIPTNATVGQTYYVVTGLPDSSESRLSLPFTVTATAAPAPTGAPVTIPGLPAGATVLDNTSPNFLYSSPGEWKFPTTGGYADKFLTTGNSNNVNQTYQWARWYFYNLPDGNHEVYVYIPVTSKLTTHAPYWVRHLNGYTKVYVDQNANQGKWVSLGTYRFDFRSYYRYFVSLSDVTGEAFRTTTVVFDAVGIVKK